MPRLVTDRQAWEHELREELPGQRAKYQEELAATPPRNGQPNVRAEFPDSRPQARLPPVNGVSRSSRGTGRPCIVCRRAIEPTEVERQVNGLRVFLCAHEACYKLWREESVASRVAKERTEEP